MAATSEDFREVYDKRLGAVERNISAIETEVRGLVHSVGGIGDKIDTLAGTVFAQQRTQWPQLLGGAALLLTVIGFVGSFYARDIGRTEKAVEKLEVVAARMVSAADYREDYSDLERRLDKVDRDVAVQAALASERARAGGE